MLICFQLLVETKIAVYLVFSFVTKSTVRFMIGLCSYLWSHLGQGISGVSLVFLT